MIVTARELNAYAVMCDHTGEPECAKAARILIDTMLENKKSSVNISKQSHHGLDEIKFAEIVKKADKALTDFKKLGRR